MYFLFSAGLNYFFNIVLPKAVKFQKKVTEQNIRIIKKILRR